MQDQNVEISIKSLLIGIWWAIVMWRDRVW
jgi:hypothetical protein